MTTPERIDDFYLQFCHEVNGKIKFDFDDAEIAIKWVQNNLKEIQETHHQELQKARNDWLREEIVKLEEMKEEIVCGAYDRVHERKQHVEDVRSHNYALQTIIDRYQSKLDQTQPEATQSS